MVSLMAQGQEYKRIADIGGKDNEVFFWMDGMWQSVVSFLCQLNFATGCPLGAGLLVVPRRCFQEQWWLETIYDSLPHSIHWLPEENMEGKFPLVLLRCWAELNCYCLCLDWDLHTSFLWILLYLLDHWLVCDRVGNCLMAWVSFSSYISGFCSFFFFLAALPKISSSLTLKTHEGVIAMKSNGMIPQLIWICLHDKLLNSVFLIRILPNKAQGFKSSGSPSLSDSLVI